jgi:integrase
MAAHRKAKITIKVVEGLKPGETVMDTDEPGFGVRLQAKAPHYFVRKFAKGQRHFQSIGEHGAGGLTVSTARERASRIIMDIRDGVSPAERRARERGMPTVAEFAKQWLELHVDSKLKSSTAGAYRSALHTLILPAIGTLKVDKVTEKDLAAMHHEARSRPYVANRSLAIVSKLMGFAEQQRFRPKGTNPASGLERFREHKRERFLSIEELVAMGAAISSSEARGQHAPQALAAIGFLLLTGMRMNEVLKLRWVEFDRDRGMLFLSDSKTGQKPVVLGKPVIELLRGTPRMAGSPWIFPSPIDPTKPMFDLRKSWATVCRLAGLEGVRLHDLRHTYASMAASSGGSLPMIGRLLGHSQAQTTARYAHLAQDPLRELADAAAGEIAIALETGRASVEPVE